MSIALLGGILLILGAFFTFKGEVMKAVGIYFLADFCWVYIAFMTGDILGGTMVFIGMLLGLAAFLKMNFGKMRKTLDW